MSNMGKIYLIATIVAAAVSLCIVLYRETSVFKSIIDGLSFAYNWVKHLGNYPPPAKPVEEGPVEEAVKYLLMLIKK